MFFAIYAFLSRLCFVAIYALLRGEKLAPNFICGEKMTNIRYVENRPPDCAISSSLRKDHDTKDLNGLKRSMEV